MTYNKLSNQPTISKVIEALSAKGYQVTQAETQTEALDHIKKLIPAKASVMNGSSRTLEQIGFVDYLKEESHGWLNLHHQILQESDPAKQSLLRKQSTVSDYYVGSVHALLENGEFIVASNTGSQLPNIDFNSQNLIFVVGTQKIVPDFNTAMDRLESYVIPLEDENMQQKYGFNTALNKILFFKSESPMMGRKIHFILVDQVLGF